MKLARSLHVFASGCVVYGVMAACSSSGDSAGHDVENRPDGSSILDPVDEAKAEPGSRLRPNYLRGDDGSRQFLGWYDTQLDTECTFLLVGSEWRCVPAATVVKLEDEERTNQLRFYEKAECSSTGGNASGPLQLAYPSASCSSPVPGQKYIATTGKDACGALTYQSYEEFPRSESIAYFDPRANPPCRTMGADRQVVLSNGTKLDLSKVIFVRKVTSVSMDTFVKATKGQ